MLRRGIFSVPVVVGKWKRCSSRNFQVSLLKSVSVSCESSASTKGIGARLYIRSAGSFRASFPPRIRIPLLVGVGVGPRKKIGEDLAISLSYSYNPSKTLDV